MSNAATLSPPVRRIHMELRTGDVLELPGVRIQLEYKKGQVARMSVSASHDVQVKKVAAIARPVPSLPS